MKFEFYFTGKATEKYLTSGIENYQRKLVHYMNTEVKIVPASQEKNQVKALKEEAAKILKTISNQDFLIVLDERGKEFSSTGLSEQIQKIMNQSWSKITFVVGSAYGIDDSLKKRTNMILSLSKFTFTHQMVRLILLEQVYRAMTIIRSESYHHA